MPRSRSSPLHRADARYRGITTAVAAEFETRSARPVGSLLSDHGHVELAHDRGRKSIPRALGSASATLSCSFSQVCTSWTLTRPRPTG